jgi:nucleoside-diphosphate-sugar epimerase
MTAAGDIRTVLVTGAAGRVGRIVTPRLVGAGFDVIALDRSPSHLDGVKRDLVGNLLDGDFCYRVLEGIDAVVHLAGCASPDAGPTAVRLHDNVAMNVNLFTAAAEMRVRRVVFASSIQVCTRLIDDRKEPIEALPPYLPLDDEAPLTPSNTYGLSKVLSERTLDYFGREYAPDGFSAVSLRLPWVTPARMQPHMRSHTRVEGWLRSGIPEAFAYLSEADTADIVRRSLTAEVQGHVALLVASAEPRVNVPVADLVEQFYREVPRLNDGPLESLVDCRRAQSLLGWTQLDGWRAASNENP